MELDTITELEIDASGRLHVIPATQQFPQIYREAMEVHWDATRTSLYSPKPRGWTYARWFNQIVGAAREQGCELRLASDTKWTNIDSKLKASIVEAADNVV